MASIGLLAIPFLVLYGIGYLIYKLVEFIGDRMYESPTIQKRRIRRDGLHARQRLNEQAAAAHEAVHAAARAAQKPPLSR
jgi:hypothetical protein